MMKKYFMKFLVAALFTIFSTKVFAAPLEAVECKREMMASALAERVKNADLETLNSSNFSVQLFEETEVPDYEYQVLIKSTNRSDQSSTYIDFAVRIKDVETCTIEVKLIAG